MKKTDSEKIKEYIPKVRKDIPKKYNQVKLLDYLMDDDVRLLISITTRGDGKTYNYLLALLKIAMKFKSFKFMLISRHFTLRKSYTTTLDGILHENFDLPRKSIFIENTNQYSKLYVNEEPLCVITELNAATDLKYYSTMLKYYRLLVYDEFIALPTDYLPDEAQRLKTIYESVARPVDNGGVLTTPKILLMGNPINFDSPLFSYFNLYHILERQKINTIEKHKKDKVVLERWKNMDSLKGMKLDTFATSKDTDNSYSGEFQTNKNLVISPKEYTMYKNIVGIKLDNEQYLVIHYDEHLNYYLEITFKKPEKIQYTTVLMGLTNGVKYLDDYYYIQSLEYEHNDGEIKYANTYTITQFDRMPHLKTLDYEELISECKPPVPIKPNAYDEEEEYQLKQVEQTKERLVREYLFNDYF